MDITSSSVDTAGCTSPQVLWTLPDTYHLYLGGHCWIHITSSSVRRVDTAAWMQQTYLQPPFLVLYTVYEVPETLINMCHFLVELCYINLNALIKVIVILFCRKIGL